MNKINIHWRFTPHERFYLNEFSNVVDNSCLFIVCPYPGIAAGIIYLMGGYRENILQAISLDKARGNAARSKAILCDYRRDTPYVPSPLLCEELYLRGYDKLYCISQIKAAQRHVFSGSRCYFTKKSAGYSSSIKSQSARQSSSSSSRYTGAPSFSRKDL